MPHTYGLQGRLPRSMPTPPAGVEMGGALKNVLAIACGISDGLGFGNNGRAALITRGLVEITRLAVASGGHPLTMGGLAGMGDLVLTCTGAWPGCTCRVTVPDVTAVVSVDGRRLCLGAGGCQ